MLVVEIVEITMVEQLLSETVHRATFERRAKKLQQMQFVFPLPSDPSLDPSCCLAYALLGIGIQTTEDVPETVREDASPRVQHRIEVTVSR